MEQSTKDIEWEFSGVTNVKIELSLDNGSTWQDIIATTPAATGSYSWNVPATESSQCFIRITDGAVFKAASWNAPAKHARGNICDQSKYGIGLYGANYLR